MRIRCQEAGCWVRFTVPDDAEPEDLESAQFFHRVSGRCVSNLAPRYAETGKRRRPGAPKPIVKREQQEEEERTRQPRPVGRPKEDLDDFLVGLL